MVDQQYHPRRRRAVVRSGRERQYHPTLKAWFLRPVRGWAVGQQWLAGVLPMFAKITREAMAEIVKVVLPHLCLDHFLHHWDKVSQGANRVQRRGFGTMLKPSRHRQHQRVFDGQERYASLMQLGGQDSVWPANAARGSRRGAVSVEQLPHYSSRPMSSTVSHSTLQLAKRRTIDMYGVTVVPQTTQQSFHHRSTAQEVRPLVIHQASSLRCQNLSLS